VRSHASARVQKPLWWAIPLDGGGATRDGDGGEVAMVDHYQLWWMVRWWWLMVVVMAMVDGGGDGERSPCHFLTMFTMVH
jgi:hypothetical protein